MANDQSLFMDNGIPPGSMSQNLGMRGQRDTSSRGSANKDQQTGAKRRKYYIKKNYQTRFIIKFCVLVVLGGFISTALIFFGTQGTLTSHFVNSQLCIHNTAQTILPCVIWSNVVTTVIILMLVTWLTLQASHKIAGTLFRFEKDLERLAGGDLNFRFQVRRGDQLSDLGNSLNLVLDNLNNSLSLLRDNAEQASQIAEQEDVSPALLDAIKQVQRDIETSYILK